MYNEINKKLEKLKESIKLKKNSKERNRYIRRSIRKRWKEVIWFRKSFKKGKERCW